jgi:polar amino acid transport system substrate-binding protein
LSISDFKGKRIGTLSGALSEKVLRSHTDIEIVAYTHETHARGDLLSGNRLDAVLLDAPMVTYYFAPEARLKVLGPPLGSLTYAMAFRKADSALRAEVNRALQELKTSGELREILERWNLWSASLMADHLQDRSPPRSAPTEYQSFVTATRGERSWRERLSLYGSFLPILLRAALVTFSISLASMVLAVVSGLLPAILRLYGGRLPGGAVLSIGAGVWIELIRGTPLLLQLFFIFYALPHFGIHLSPWVAAILGLGLNYGAAEAENYRAGILSVPKGQWEAAQALGFKQTQALTHIVIPQGVRLVIPSMTNDFIALLKDSSLVSVITMVELTKAYSQLSSTYYDYIGPALMACVLYLLMGLPFVRIAKYAEEKLSRGYGAHAG